MINISFYNFTKLLYEEQWEILFKNGEFIGSKISVDKEFVLYKLFAFYVEVEYNKISNKIITMKCFLDYNKNE